MNWKHRSDELTRGCHVYNQYRKSCASEGPRKFGDVYNCTVVMHARNNVFGRTWVPFSGHAKIRGEVRGEVVGVELQFLTAHRHVVKRELNENITYFRRLEFVFWKYSGSFFVSFQALHNTNLSATKEYLYFYFFFPTTEPGGACCIVCSPELRRV